MSISVEQILTTVKPLGVFQKEVLQAIDEYHSNNEVWPSSAALTAHMFANPNQKRQERVTATLGRLRKRGVLHYTKNTWQFRDPTVIVEQRPSELAWLKIIQEYYDTNEVWPTIADLAVIESTRMYYRREDYWKSSYPTLPAYQLYYPAKRFESGVKERMAALRRRGYLDADETQIIIVRYHPTRS